ncbi:MAG: acetyl-CoA carboxylase biotin carboxyl carrier protein subunit [Bacteroidota bacterium]
MKNQYRVSVNEAYEFELSAADVGSLDLIPLAANRFHLISDRKTYTADLLSKDFANRTYVVSLNQQQYHIQITDALEQLIADMGYVLEETATVDRILAPMPGLILEVAVTPGQEVRQGAPLLVLEAMKMENVVTAPCDGVIGEIGVIVGDAVEKNQVLLHFE